MRPLEGAPMKLFAVALLFSTLTAQAEILKLHDGTVAKCESKADVLQHSVSGVYRPVSLIGNKIKIEILTCRESGSGFRFKRDADFEDKTIRTIVGPERTLHVEHSALSILLVNGDSKLIDKKELIKGKDNLYSAELNLSDDSFLEFHIQSQLKLSDAFSGEVIDQGVDSYGAFRIK